MGIYFLNFCVYAAALLTLFSTGHRVYYVIEQNVIDDTNRTSGLIVSTEPNWTEHAYSEPEFIFSKNGNIVLPGRSDLFCEKKSMNELCKCDLNSVTEYPVLDEPLSTIWKLEKNEKYQLNPVPPSLFFQKVVTSDEVCLDESTVDEIKRCHHKSSFAEVRLNYPVSFGIHDNITALNGDLHKKDLCQSSRLPNAYLCTCTFDCYIIGAVNLSFSNTEFPLNVSLMNLANFSWDNITDLHIVFPKQLHVFEDVLSERCRSKIEDISGFLLDSQSLKTIDFVLSIVSVVALFLTIFVFANCPELRNLHGKNLMSLSVTIFFSQILFLHDVGVQNDHLCAGIGALLHYCWLSVFVWTSTMAFDLARTFRVKSSMNQRQAQEGNKRYLKYAVVAWGFPAVIVLTCVIANAYLNDINEIYGTIVDGGVCMASIHVMLYGLFLPFSFAIVFNIVCFAIIVHGIESNKSNRSRNHQNLEKTRCFIYGKISILLGLSWILCLVATISSSRAFWFSFSIMTNLQGVGIFVSFILLNRRVRGMVKRQLTGSQDFVSVIPNVQNAYEHLQQDRCESAMLERIIDDTTDRCVQYQNSAYSPEEITTQD